jgi:HlyD family secretion protein
MAASKRWKSQRREEAEAQLQLVVIAVDTAHSQIAQREAETDAAEAVVAQAQAELGAPEKRLARKRC